MRKIAVAALLAVVALLAASCYCPRCPIDSIDGVDVFYPGQPSADQLGALASLSQLIAAEVGPESPVAQAIEAGFAGDVFLIGTFYRSRETASLAGYVRMKDGRISLEKNMVDSAPQDARYLGYPRVWQFLPWLYAAGWRLARGGTWADSETAAREFAARLAATLEQGDHLDLLAPGTSVTAFAEVLRRWRTPQ